MQADTPDSVRTYLLGDDCIAQRTNGNTQYLLYDGHGSTRQLARWTGTDIAVDDSYSYDGYGVFLQPDYDLNDDGVKTPQQQTSLLYAGEHFDFNSQQYYNRARWYNPLSGLFNQVDPYAGNLHDPQSLHKYLYCHANPVNAIDPSGMIVTIPSLTTTQSISSDLRSRNAHVSMATGAKATVAVAQGTFSMLRISLLLAAMVIPTASLLLTLYGWSSILQFLNMIDERTTNAAFQIIKTSQQIGKVAAALKTAEQTAVYFAQKIGITADQVKDLPIFFVFQSLTPYIYEHDLNAITHNPYWVALQYVGTGNDALRKQNGEAARAGKQYLYNYLKGLNSLDEYPFAATFQGGACASVAAVPIAEQYRQGGQLKVFFYGKLQGRPEWFLVVPVPI